MRSSILLMLLLLASPAYAAVDELRAQSLFREIRCMVCAGESIAESSAEVAVDVRSSVREMMEQGKSDAEIKAFLVSRYGETVLMKPPLTANTLALWLGPVALLFLMLSIAYAYFSSKRISEP